MNRISHKMRRALVFSFNKKYGFRQIVMVLPKIWCGLIENFNLQVTNKVRYDNAASFRVK